MQFLELWTPNNKKWNLGEITKKKAKKNVTPNILRGSRFYNNNKKIQ